MIFHKPSVIRRRDMCARVGGVFLLLLGACSREPVPSGVLHLVPDGVEEQALIVGRVSRMGFASPVGAEHRVRLTVPKGESKLLLGYAAPVRETPDAGSATGFYAALHGLPDGPATVLDASGGAQWEEAVVELRPYAGRNLELVLRSRGTGTERQGSVYWATPLVLGESGDCPNILLISIDCLRADHVGCYGYDRPTTPTLDSLASEGCMFSRATAQSSWTLPSHASLFTSLYLKSHRVGTCRDALASRAWTLAELLRDAGYATAAIVSGGPLHPSFGLNQGFDLYDASCYTSDIEDVTAPCTHARARTCLRRFGDGPLFLFVHYWDVHEAYAPPPPYDTLFTARVPPGDRTARLAAAYDGEIVHTDRYAGLLFDDLRACGLSERTLVIVTSDHGDELLEHGGRGHGRTLFQEVIHVPLLWSEPGTEGGGLVDQPVQIIDIAPTIMDALGLQIPADMQGVSFLPLLRRGQQPANVVYSEVWAAGNLKAALLRSTKVLCSLDDGRYWAYDLAMDPGEQNPLPPEVLPHGELVRRALAEFVPSEDLETVALELRAVGGIEPGDILVRLNCTGLLDFLTRDLEPDDSARVDRDLGTVLLALHCRPGDIDRLRLVALSKPGVVNVEAESCGRALPQHRMILGAGERPPAQMPFKIALNDPRLQGTPEMLGSRVPADSLQLHLWVEVVERLAATARLDGQTTDELRALGYLR